MRRGSRWIAVLLALGGLSLLPLLWPLLAPAGRAPLALRGAPAIPAPDDRAKLEFFYRLMTAGETAQVASPLEGAGPLEIPVWREIGAVALGLRAASTVEFLTSPDRYPEYRAAPNVLITVLQLLAELPAARDAPALYPFLGYWLDPGNCPPSVPGSDWPEEIRAHVFGVMRRHPAAAALPHCLDELRRPRRTHELRGSAIDIVLQTGHGAVLRELAPVLPPNAQANEPDLRMALLDRLYRMAGPSSDPTARAQVEALEGFVADALQSGRAVERFNAMGVFLRLGRQGAADSLVRFFEENRADEPAAWSALLLLAADDPAPFAREACLARVERPDGGVGFTTAVRLLARWWPGDLGPRVWTWIREGRLDPYAALPALLRHDREAVVAWLKEEIRTEDQGRLIRALVFAAGERVAETGPALLERAREVEPPQRAPFYKALAALRTPGAEALFLAELRPSSPALVRSAAVTELLNLGGERGTARLAELVAEGDGPALDAFLRRARTIGERAVPTPVVPALLHALRTLPSEDDRIAVLFTLRFRGRFDDVRAGLSEAYRHEPSLRVERAILAAIRELAHR